MAPVLDSILPADHYESLMLDGFEETNVRGLIDIADRIVTKVVSRVRADQAVDEVFKERYGAQHAITTNTGPGMEDRVAKGLRRSGNTPRDDLKVVEETYNKVGANVSHIERELRRQNINFSRKKISKILDDLNLPREKRK